MLFLRITIDDGLLIDFGIGYFFRAVGGAYRVVMDSCEFRHRGVCQRFGIFEKLFLKVKRGFFFFNSDYIFR